MPQKKVFFLCLVNQKGEGGKDRTTEEKKIAAFWYYDAAGFLTLSCQVWSELWPAPVSDFPDSILYPLQGSELATGLELN